MKKICLWSFNGLGLIIKYPSGVIYTNQAGGYACLQPQEEGILSILETEEPQQKKRILLPLFYLLTGLCFINQWKHGFI